jgi:hypothetical protein
MEKFVCIRFSRKTGKIDKTLEGLGCGMLELWALENTTAKSKDTIVFSKVTGDVVMYCVGTGGFPQIEMRDRGAELGNINDYCPGLLAQLQEEDEED